jgi:hypothetical protein
MKSKAVLFGINYNSTPASRLRGCIHDVENIATFLEDTAKYDIVKTYTDKNNDIKVTGNHIINTIYKLAIESHRLNLERVWIHYSGHGCSIKDRDGDEIDGKDECIVPADYAYNGVITDDLIKKVLRYFNKNTKVTCVFDCCHSGTIGDLKYKHTYNPLDKKLISEEENKDSKCKSNILLLSGCMDSQTSADAYNVRGMRQFSGAMTSCLLSAMLKSSNVLSVLEIVTELLQQKRFTQIPQLTSSFSVDHNTNIY